jgi:hypothetical protein
MTPTELNDLKVGDRCIVAHFGSNYRCVSLVTLKTADRIEAKGEQFSQIDSFDGNGSHPDRYLLPFEALPLLRDTSTHRPVSIRFTHPHGYAAQNTGTVPRKGATVNDLFGVVPELDPGTYRLVWAESGRPVVFPLDPTGGEVFRAERGSSLTAPE